MDFPLDEEFKRTVLSNPRIEFSKYDIQDLENISNLIKEGDVVVNLAALVGAPLCDQKSEEAKIVNNIAAQKLAQLCMNKKIKLFIQFSTCSNYGQAKEPVDENGKLLPTSLYAETKVELEKFLLENIPNSLILRCATVFGVSKGRMRFDLLLSDFMKDAWLNRKINVFKPEVHRPLVHIDDICKAVLLCIEKPEITSRVYNVGSNSQNYTKREIAEAVSKKMNVPLKIIDKEDKRDYIVEFGKINKELDFTTDYSVEYGINEMLEVLKKENMSLEQNNV